MHSQGPSLPRSDEASFSDQMINLQFPNLTNAEFMEHNASADTQIIFVSKQNNQQEKAPSTSCCNPLLAYFLNFSITSAKVINQLQKPSGTEQRGRFILERLYSEYLAL